MSQYSILHQTVLIQSPLVSSDPDPTGGATSLPGPGGPATTAALPDGSFLVAGWIKDTDTHLNSGTDTGVLRLWRLSAALVVLGTTDITHAAITTIPHQPIYPIAVTTIGMTVFLAAQRWTSGSDAVYSSWIIDCSSATPVPSVEQAMATDRTLYYGQYGAPIALYDLNTDRILLAVLGQFTGVTVLQVFRASTGALLCEVASTEHLFELPMGFFMDPSDSTRFAVTGSSNATQFAFTVALDGTSGSYGGMTTTTGSYSYPTASSSPYLVGGEYVLDLAWDSIGDWMNLSCFDSNNALVATINGAPDGYIEANGGWVTLGGKRHVITTYEMGFSLVPYNAVGEFQARLVAIDVLANPPVIEILELPYLGLPSSPLRSLSYMGVGGVAASQASGRILVAATVDTMLGSTGAPFYMDSLLLWIIQGPGNDPNLTGQVLDSRVRFRSQ